MLRGESNMKNSKKRAKKITNNDLAIKSKYLWDNGTRTRSCPKCQAIIYYKDKYSYIYGEQDNIKCKKCVASETAINYDYKNKFSGKNNPFYGHHHTKKTKNIFSKKANDRGFFKNENPMKTAGMKEYFSKLYSGEGNPRYNQPVTKKTRKKLSIATRGKNNPMYGKPSPNGSGNGWASWYKGMHFRSLRELQYYITEIESNGMSCENGQMKKFKSEYKNYDGTDRTYHPDFFVGGKYLIEIKPKAMWNTPLVILKKKAAEKLCNKMGWEYKLVDITPNSRILREKYLNGEIKFVEKYKEKFEKYADIK
jgi:hypothetical protein